MARLQVPRGTAAQLDAATFLPGEIAVDTTNDELRYDGDGSTVGGIALARKDGANLTASAARVIATGSTTARTLANRFGEVANVKDYGATGDGTTNDTTAISAAITAAGTGGAVYFPEGVYIFNSVLTQLSGQRWFGAGRAVSILRLASSVTSIAVCVTASNFATDYSIEDMQIDGNRENITPAADLYSNFYLVRGPRGGQRGLYRNLILSNSWGRVLQTSDETQSEYATDIVVENVWVTNAGTKAISATRSKRVTISNCFAEVDPYADADHPGSGDATSGSCFEVNESIDVVIKGCHGVQIGASIEAPGIRLINASAAIRVFGNTIDDASYLGFIQNVDDVDFFGNIGRDLKNNAILISDDDTVNPTDTCKRIRVHHNTIIDPDDAFVYINASKDGYNAYVECYIYDNDFVQKTGTPTYGIYNNGVIAPAIGGTCTVHEWGNRYTGTIPNRRAGPAAHEIQPHPDASWQTIATSTVASASHTGTTAETTIATITIPADRMGKNGILKITDHWAYTNTTANNKISRVRFGGSQAVSATVTANTQVRRQIEIGNQNSLSSQIVNVPGVTAGFGATNTAVTTLAIDTSADADITLTAQLADATDAMVLRGYTIELLYRL